MPERIGKIARRLSERSTLQLSLTSSQLAASRPDLNMQSSSRSCIAALAIPYHARQTCSRRTEDIRPVRSRALVTCAWLGGAESLPEREETGARVDERSDGECAKLRRLSDGSHCIEQVSR